MMTTKEEFLENVNFRRYPKFKFQDIHEGNPARDTTAIVLTCSNNIEVCKYKSGEWYRAIPESNTPFVKGAIKYWIPGDTRIGVWRENRADNKPSRNHSVLIKTEHGGIAEGEWKGDGSWLQYRWSAKLEDCKVLAWTELDNIEAVPVASNTENENPGSSKFDVGAWVVQKSSNVVGQVEDIDFIYRKKTGDFSARYYIRDLDDHVITELAESDLKLWSIKEDAKDSDVLAYPDGSIVIFKTLHSGEDEGVFTAYVLYVDNHIELENTCAVANVHPATKEKREFLFTKLSEAGYSWDSKKKNLVNSSNPSREDIISFADYYSHHVWNDLMEKRRKLPNYTIGCNDVSDIVLNAIIDAFDHFTAITKFKVGDWCFNTVRKFTFCIAKVDYVNYHIIITPSGHKVEIPHKELESNSKFWDINDAKDGDLLGYSDADVLVQFKSLVPGTKAFESHGCLSHGLFCPGPDTYVIEGAHPVTKEQYSEYIEKRNEAGYGKI